MKIVPKCLVIGLKGIEENQFCTTAMKQQLNILNSRAWQTQIERNRCPSLLRALIYAFWPQLVALGILCFLSEFVSRLSLALALGKLLTYFK